MAQQYGDRAEFVAIYVREAHPTDGWRMESNDRVGVAVAQPKDFASRNAVANQFRKEDARGQVMRSCEAFIRMYRPHEAREDTVLFPALHRIVPAKQLKELGEQFEKEEDKLCGEEGFEKTVDQVAAIEKQLGIYDLSQFTPK